MSDKFVQVAPDSTGKLIQTFENTVNAQTVEAQAVVTVDTTGVAAVAGRGSNLVAGSQVTASGTAGTLAIARPTRKSCLFRNLDSSLSVYIGPATVTSANGMILKAGESIPVTAVILWQVIAPSGSPVVAVMDEYD